MLRLLTFCILCALIIYVIFVNKENEKHILQELERLEKYKSKELDKLEKQQDKLSNFEKVLGQKENDINSIIHDSSQNASWLANRLIDYQEMQDNALSNYLINKNRPAKKSAQIVSEISKEKRFYFYKAKTLQYQLDYLMHVFPMLEEAIEINAQDLEKMISEIDATNSTNDEYETVMQWLSPEEYLKLPTAKKYQLALDRYLRRHKSPWQIGIAYERYIGYIYETQGYSVIFNGALKGKEDFGRDVIAENDKEILIIQCKYWKKEKIIHENHIFQLYGTTILKKIELKQENKKKKVVGVFITSTILSPEAKMVAKELGIIVKENEDFKKDYPCIKCNTNKTTGEKIYHLPFDQQYDRIKIVPNLGQCYVSTVEEAEKLGFRKAKKHVFNNKNI